MNERDILAFSETIARVRAETGKEIIGQETVVEHMLMALVAGGNVLLEGVPGLGKTRLVRALGRVSDLMPADITGTNIIVKTEEGNAFEFRPGPLFASIVLADEINRATPKTQSALLEAMQEHSVTVAGTTYALQEPYFVLATQNPVEQEGTYPLPEAQLDRFLFKVNVPFPSMEELGAIVDLTTGGADGTASQVCGGADILAMREIARQVPVAQAVREYALKLVMDTHPERAESPEIARRYLRFGASPRAAQAIFSTARVRALMHGRFNVAFEDVDAVAPACLRHRIALNFEGVADGASADGVIETLLKEK